MSRRAVEERFWSKVAKGAGVDDCWLWTGSKSRGYGTFRFPKFRMYAHVLSFEAYCGEVGEGLELDHLCRNRACVNPNHLEPVTHQENIRRGFAARSERLTVKNSTMERAQA